MDRVFPAHIVESLLAVPNDGLLVGFRDTGAALIRDGKVITYPVADGQSMGTLRGFALGKDGTVWAAAYHGLFRLVHSEWQRVGKESSYVGTGAQAVFVDRAGTLWVADNNSIVFLPPNEKRFRPTAEGAVGHPFEVNSILQAPDGAIWIGETSWSVRPLILGAQTIAKHRAEIEVGSYGLLFDDAGSLWIASLGDGIGRISAPGAIKSYQTFQAGAQVFSQKDGLSSDYVMAVLGTSVGLDRFQESRLGLSALPSKSSDLILIPGDKGDLWTGSLNYPFTHVEGRMLTRMQQPRDWATTCGFRDPDGTIWVGGPLGIGRSYRGQFVTVC